MPFRYIPLNTTIEQRTVTTSPGMTALRRFALASKSGWAGTGGQWQLGREPDVSDGAVIDSTPGVIIMGANVTSVLIGQKVYGAFIGGEFAVPRDLETFAVHKPATGREMARVVAADAALVDRAVKDARRVHELDWRHRTPREPGQLLRQLAACVALRRRQGQRFRPRDDGGNAARVRARKECPLPVGSRGHPDLAAALTRGDVLQIVLFSQRG